MSVCIDEKRTTEKGRLKTQPKIICQDTTEKNEALGR